MELALDCWGRQLFMTERDAPKVSMMADFAQPNTRFKYSSLSFLDFQLAGAGELSALKAFVHELSEAYLADYAMAHILTRTELEGWVEHVAQRPTSWPAPPAEQMAARMRARIEREGYTKVLWGCTALKINTVQLRTCLPDLYWLNVFGPSYASIFGKQRVLEVPSKSAESLSYGGVSVNLTKDLPDTVEAWEKFKEVRAQCRTYLDSNVFCRSTAEKDHKYCTPQLASATTAETH